MFCPLCKAEYRQGINFCRDCKVNLVFSQEEAKRVPIALMWKGSSQGHFVRIIDALAASNIPCNGRSSARSNQPISFSLWSFLGYSRRSIAKQMSWEIWVLESDLPATTGIAGSVQ